MPPDVQTLLTFLALVLAPAVQAVGGFVVALFALIFLFALIQELLSNAQGR